MRVVSNLLATLLRRRRGAWAAWGCLLRLLNARRPRRAGRTITAVDDDLDGVGSRLQGLAPRIASARAARHRRATRCRTISRTRARREASRRSASRPAKALLEQLWFERGARRSRPLSPCSLSLTAIMYLNCRAAASARGTRASRSRYAQLSEQYALRGCFDGVRARGQQTALRETRGSVLSTARPIEPWMKSETPPETL